MDVKPWAVTPAEFCVYPQRAIDSSAGSTDAASSFYCGGNVETQETVCNDTLTRYKHEIHGRLDFDDTGASAD